MSILDILENIIYTLSDFAIYNNSTNITFYSSEYMGMGDEMINYLPDDEQQNDEKVQKEHKKCK